jgi:hypothetical protein
MSDSKQWEPTPEQAEDIMQGLRELDSGQGLTSDEAKKAMESGVLIGDKMPDGTILAGYYEDKPLYTTPTDAPLTYTFNEAAKYADQLNARKYLGHDDWRVPSKGELNVLFVNCNQGKLKGTFNDTGSFSAGWYWSSTPLNDYIGWEQRFNDYVGWAQRFSDGNPNLYYRFYDSSLRCVRG